MKMESLIAASPAQRFLDMVRGAETEIALRHIPEGARLLEIGAGTGLQAREFSRRGFDVSAIDLASSLHAGERVFPVQDYDGAHIPFPAASFDVVFSSSVLEHVKDLPAMHAEIKRVLRPGGECLHVMPTHAWRNWMTLAAYPAVLKELLRVRPRAAAKKVIWSVLLQKRHGERGNLITEAWYFRPLWWERHFRENGFDIAASEAMGLFYTGEGVFGTHLPIAVRQRLARFMGSVTHLYRMRPA